MSFLKCKIYKGYHSEEAFKLISHAWKNEELLLLAPPQIDSEELFHSLPLETRLYKEKPVFGLLSTGTEGQKLVLYSKKNIQSSLDGILSLFDPNRIEEIFCYPQPFHTFGLTLGYCQALHFGRELKFFSGRYGRSSHELWFQTQEPNRMTLGTPTHFKDLLQFLENEIPEASYTSIIGGAQVEKELWLKVHDKLNILAPSIGYGATEASPGVTHLAPGLAPTEDGEVGEFLPHVAGTLTPEGVQFKGPNVCLAIYDGRALSFPKELTLQDRLEARADGTLVYRGRHTFILNRGGEKFSLEAIENAIRAKLGIETVCVSLPHERLGEELGILSESSTKDGIFNLLQRDFGRGFEPKNFCFISKLPQNASSKVDRKQSMEFLKSQLDAQ